MAKSTQSSKGIIAPIEEEVLSSSNSGDLITISSKDRTKADFPKKEEPKFEAPGTGDGGSSAGPGDSSGPGLGAGQGKKSFGDTTAPVFDPNGDYDFEYDENQLIGAVVGTVVGASDAGGGITQYRFAVPPSGASLVVQATNSVSSDGYFEIDNTGKIILTELGWAATVNDYDDQDKVFDYYIEAGDAAGNWSSPQKITLSLKDIGQGTGGSVYLSLDRTGVWLDANEDGKRDQGETEKTLTASGGLYRVDGVDMEADNVTIRVVDFMVATPLDLKGFGSGDKLIYDYNTNKSDWYGFGSYAAWDTSNKPVFDSAFLNKKVFDSRALYTNNLFSGARYSKNGIGYVDYSQSAGRVTKGSNVTGLFRAYFGAKPYSFVSGRASVTKLISGWKAGDWDDMKAIGALQFSKYATLTTRASAVIASGVGPGYNVDVVQPSWA